ncbi:Phasin [uncultured Gammaproteobacteria bacterium]
MANPNPFQFFETDVTKLLSNIKIPGVDIEVIVSAQRKNIEALTAANEMALEGIQAVARRQAEILRQTMEETGKLVSDMVAAGGTGNAAVNQAELVKGAFEKALGNMKELAEMVAKSNTDATTVISKRVGEGLEEMKSVMSKALKK